MDSEYLIRGIHIRRGDRSHKITGYILYHIEST